MFILLVLLINLFIIIFVRSECECGNCEEVFGGEDLSKAEGEAVFGGVRAHRSSKEREFSWNLSPTINLRGDPDRSQGESRGCVLCSPGPTG